MSKKTDIEKYQPFYDKAIKSVTPSVAGYITVVFEDESKLDNTPDPLAQSE